MEEDPKFEFYATAKIPFDVKWESGCLTIGDVSVKLTGKHIERILNVLSGKEFKILGSKKGEYKPEEMIVCSSSEKPQTFYTVI